VKIIALFISTLIPFCPLNGQTLASTQKMYESIQNHLFNGATSLHTYLYDRNDYQAHESALNSFETAYLEAQGQKLSFDLTLAQEYLVILSAVRVARTTVNKTINGYKQYSNEALDRLAFAGQILLKLKKQLPHNEHAKNNAITQALNTVVKTANQLALEEKSFVQAKKFMAIITSIAKQE
jgi:hypothetical protein